MRLQAVFSVSGTVLKLASPSLSCTLIPMRVVRRIEGAVKLPLWSLIYFSNLVTRFRLPLVTWVLPLNQSDSRFRP